MWSKSKNRSKISLCTATVTEPESAEVWHTPQSTPLSLPSQRSCSMLSQCRADHRQGVAVCGLVLMVPCLLCGFAEAGTTGPDAYTRPRFLPVVAIRRHGTNDTVLKKMVSYTLCLHLWCLEHPSMNPDRERKLAGVGCNCGSKEKQQKLKWHGREEMGRLDMKCRGREWQVRGAGKGWGRKEADSC